MTTYTENVVPFRDKSMEWFIEALTKASPLGPAQVRAIVHQCWRDIRNASTETPDDKP